MAVTLDQAMNTRPFRQAPRPRPALGDEFAAIYAIGDVHGRLDLLLRLEDQITADAAGLGPGLIVMLGDYVDRGPSSAQVVEHLIAPAPPGFARICLAGNHEEAMADFMRDPSNNLDWLDAGGIETLLSYGIDLDELRTALPSEQALRLLLAPAIPAAHIEFIDGLAGMLSLPGYVFAHAGIRPGIALAEQDDADLLWIRFDFLDSSSDFGAVVVHGHTPVRVAEIRANRIGVDTGAFATGILSAVALKPAGPRILTARLPR